MPFHNELKKDYILHKSYRIINTIGRGGFGITYRASRITDNTTVCIKEYFPGALATRDQTTGRITAISDEAARQFSDYKAKFLKEARTLIRLRHPNIISVIETFEDNDTVYYAMEYIQGSPLSELIAQGPIAEELALELIEPITNAIDYVHKQNLCHFDIKPDNILIDDDARPVLIDFGLVKHYDHKGKETTGTPLGISEGYAPVEQYQTNGVSRFSPETDVYALGATYYTMITGKTPPPSTLLIDNPLTFPAGISQAARDGIMAAMSPDRETRLKSASQFYRIISGKEVSEPVEKNNNNDASRKKPNGHSNVWKKFFHSKWFIIISIIISIALIIYGIVFFINRSNTLEFENERPLHEKLIRTNLQSLKDVIGDSRIYEKSKLLPMTLSMHDDTIQMVVDLDNKTKPLFDDLSSKGLDKHVKFMIFIYDLYPVVQKHIADGYPLTAVYNYSDKGVNRQLSKTFVDKSDFSDDNITELNKYETIISFFINKYKDKSTKIELFDGAFIHYDYTLEKQYSPNDENFDTIIISDKIFTNWIDAIIELGIRPIYNIHWIMDGKEIRNSKNKILKFSREDER